MKSLTKPSKRFITTLFVGNFGILQAMGSIFNVPGNYYRFEYGNGTLLTDAKAIQNDWNVAGQDMQDVVRKYSYNSKQLS